MAELNGSGAILRVDLSALTRNWRRFAGPHGADRCAAVVKADAYGLGVAAVAPALRRAGCRHFFVATVGEALELRSILPGAGIFALSPLLDPLAIDSLAAERIIPVLNDMDDVGAWAEQVGRSAPCALMVDTGMNRLGLSIGEAIGFAGSPRRSSVDLSFIMTHFASAGEDEAMTRRQIDHAGLIRRHYPAIPLSIANSSGAHFVSEETDCLLRPGIGLYGSVEALTGHFTPDRVAHLSAPILKVWTARAGETVSYGGTHRLTRDSRLATVAIGYADGLPRCLSGAGVPLRFAIPEGGVGVIDGRHVPIVGRVTMDLTIFDVTDLDPDLAGKGDRIEIFGKVLSIDDVAGRAGTIAYEMLTSISPRVTRRYSED